MKKVAFLLAILALPVFAQEGKGQSASPSPLPEARPGMAAGMLPARGEELRERREMWREMTPEERHRFRSDIREAGRTLYPHRSRKRDAR